MIRIYFPPNDTDRIMDIWLNGNKQAHCFIPGSYWESCAQEVQSLLSQADVFVWEEEGLIKGFAGMPGQLSGRNFVDKAFRCAGIAKSFWILSKNGIRPSPSAFTKKTGGPWNFICGKDSPSQRKGWTRATGHAEYTLTWNPQGA